jgi:hypothetical protein
MTRTFRLVLTPRAEPRDHNPACCRCLTTSTVENLVFYSIIIDFPSKISCVVQSSGRFLQFTISFDSSLKMVNASLPSLDALSLSAAWPTWPAWPWTTILVTSFLLYVGLCNLLRFQRRDAMQRKFGYPDRASLSRMTNVDAQAILVILAQFEFPKSYLTSIQFALFKVRGLAIFHNVVKANSYIRPTASLPYVSNARAVGQLCHLTEVDIWILAGLLVATKEFSTPENAAKRLVTPLPRLHITRAGRCCDAVTWCSIP